METKKWVFHYAALKANVDVQTLKFSTMKERMDALANLIIGNYGKVFLLEIDLPNGNGSDKYFQIFVFERWPWFFNYISKSSAHFGNPDYEMYLHEYESYEDAYRSALEMRKENPLCYNSNVPDTFKIKL